MTPVSFITVRLEELDDVQREALAHSTWIAGREHAPAWLPTLDAAQEEISDALQSGKVSRVALGADGTPLGWIAAAPTFGRVWELHPLVIAVAYQRRGIGRQLVREIEDHARSEGALTMTLGTSDSTRSTSLSGVDLYDDPLGAMARMVAHEPHAVVFWQRVGYHLVGVIPDAEGPGQPSIHLAKRLAVE